MKYFVYVRREECQYVEVDAPSPADAVEEALKKAASVEWGLEPRFDVLAVEEER